MRVWEGRGIEGERPGAGGLLVADGSEISTAIADLRGEQ